MGLLEQWKGVRYRARIFDHGLFIRSIEVPDRGQRYITITVKAKTLGIIGEDTKLAFMINPDIQPKIFGGFIQELDFDIKDSAPMADLLDIVPDLVYEINESYKALQEMRESPDIEKLVEPTPLETPPVESAEKAEEEKKPAPPQPKKSGLIRTGKKLADTLSALKRSVDGPGKNQLIKDCLDICQEYPKLLYWLPKYLGIDLEVHAICSQSKIKRAGLIPSYYIAQSNAMIAEKVLARPAQKQGWQEIILILGCLIILVGFVALVLHAAGMI